MAIITPVARVGFPLLVSSAFLFGCQGSSNQPAAPGAGQTQAAATDQSAEREQMILQGDALIARGKKMYDRGVAAHDDAMVQDGRLLMTRGQQMKDKALMLRQTSVRKSRGQ